MKTKLFSFRGLLLTLFTFCFIFHSLDAQKAGKQLWFQWDDVVYPAKIAEYVEAIKAFTGTQESGRKRMLRICSRK